MKNSCYSNIRQYLQDDESCIIDTPTTTDALSTNKRRKLLHKFLDEDEDEDAHAGNTDINE
jgi:replicative superfamily II helicase